jgi:hypothetical protein
MLSKEKAPDLFEQIKGNEYTDDGVIHWVYSTRHSSAREVSRD